MSRDRITGLQSWHDDWHGIRAVVLGLGVTGFAAADTLAELGASVVVVANRNDDDREAMLRVLGVDFVLADADTIPAQLQDAELVIASPGLPPTHSWIRIANEHAVVWGDIELAWRVRDKVHAADWLLVTGTNGKTTTTQLAAHMLREGGVRVAPVGNIGTPVLDAVRDPQGFDALVVELSSFQLHSLGQIAPHSAACLNLDDDHIDWHGSAKAYRDAKAKVFAGTRIAAIYNVADQATMQMVEEADVTEGCRAIGFGLGVPGLSELGIVDGLLVDRAFLDARKSSALELATLDDLKPAGLATPHMAQNVLAAAALARAYGVDPQAIRAAVLSFELDHHRTEFVAEIDSVRFVDDSKATNPHAANGSLQAFDSVVWIVGGLLKGVDVAPLVERHASRLRAAVVIGVDRAPVVAAFARHAPGIPVTEVDESDTGLVMRRAVETAAAAAQAGDTVLLAPAAASMDQFTDYGDRGRQFARAVRERESGGDNNSDANPDLNER